MAHETRFVLSLTMASVQPYHVPPIVLWIWDLCLFSTALGMVIQSERSLLTLGARIGTVIQSERAFLTLGARPNIDMGKCPEVRVEQNFQKEQGPDSIEKHWVLA